MFNGKSRFGLSGSPAPLSLGTIILDDAHASFATLRDCFTLTIGRAEVEDFYSEMSAVFRESFHDIDKGGTFDDLMSGRESGQVLEVPYWAWIDRRDSVLAIVCQHLDDDAFKNEALYHWPLMRDNFRYCTCLISNREVMITPLFPLVDMIPAFGTCPRRIYMSATISDDSSIVRTFDADWESVAKPITSTSLAGVSERMVLIPALTPISDSADKVVHALVEIISTDHKKGVLVLAPSLKSAKLWEKIANLSQTTDEVGKAIESLKQGDSTRAVVLANRYDGIDLPGDSCRLLVMSGLPRGVSAYDLHQAATFGRGELINAEIARRLEQGIGRGGRGPRDFCVVVLLRTDLVNWVSTKKNQALLTTSTRAQIQIGFEIAGELKTGESLTAVVLQCLNRDSDWKAYHAERLAELISQDTIASDACELAGSERKAFSAWLKGDVEKSIDQLRKIGDQTREEDPTLAGWYYQLAARIALHAGITDLSKKFQREAYGLNSALHRPKGPTISIPVKVPGAQAHTVAKVLESYAIRWGIMSRFKEIKTFLTSNASSNQFEQSFSDLGALLGFAVDRPDNRFSIGPDVLWLPEKEPAFILEAKTRKKIAKALSKEEHGQLLNAEEWFKETYPGRDYVRACIHPNAFSSDSVVPGETLVLTWPNLAKLTDSVQKFLEEIAVCLETGAALTARCQAAIEKYGLSATDIRKRCFERLGVAN